MKKRDFVLSIIALCSKSSSFGRTSLQKVTYFAGRERDVDLGHRAHFYGPFSSDVEGIVGDLCLSGLVTEKANTLGFSPSGKEWRRYEYELTEDGTKRFELISKKYPADIKALKGLAEKLGKHASQLDQRTLSIAAKVYFIRNEEGRDLSKDDIKELAKNRNWSLSAHQITDVNALLEELPG